MVLAVIVATVTGVAAAAHAAQVKANAEHAMTAAAPAYQGAIELGGDLDALAAQSVQAKSAYDAEQARLAAEAAQRAADEAARAAQEAADAAARQAADAAAAQEAAAQSSSDSSDDASGGSAPSGGDGAAGGGLPSGTPVPSPNGYYDTTLCASGSASTINGVPTCD